MVQVFILTGESDPAQHYTRWSWTRC